MPIPLLELLRNAPSFPHKIKGERIEGFIFKNKDGMWLRIPVFNPNKMDQVWPIDDEFIWISDSDKIEKL